MADTVTTQTIADTSGLKFVVKMTNMSDGTGETDVKKFLGEDGKIKKSIFRTQKGSFSKLKSVRRLLRAVAPRLNPKASIPSIDVVGSTL